MYEVKEGLEYYSSIAAKYHIKTALVSWIVRKFTQNPGLLDDIELKSYKKTVNR